MAEPTILQVTYGAFSCTLEGFEDPVETLKAVAEYFRDLAARDPGFAGVGAVPDAAEMARQVRAAGAGPVEVRVEAADAVPETFAGPEDGVPPDAEPPTGSALRPNDEALGAVPLAEAGDEGADRLALGLVALRRARLAEEGDEEADAGSDITGEEPWVTDAGDSPAERTEAEDGPGPGSPLPDPIPPSAQDREVEETETPATGSSKEARRLLSTSPDEGDALGRILSRAESQLADPKVARRREALAHVKAAIAAAEAGRAVGDALPQPEGNALFREDLSAARPAAAEERPAAPPLRLVASQRVDLPRMKAALAGRPSVPHGTETGAAPRSERALAEPSPPREDAKAGSFAQFADEVGATALPDLLEAAAHWLAREGGPGEACRTKLLELAAEVLAGEPSREEALRVFGTLLREGRLARAGNGRFRPGPLSRLGPARLAG